MLGVGLASVVVFSTTSAHAEPGTIVLTDGTSIGGDILELVTGDHLAIKLPNGQIKTVAWADLASLQIGASGSIVIGGGSATSPQPIPAPQPVPPPPIVYVPPPPPVVYAPPPPVVYAPPPPQPAYYPQPMPQPPPRFRPAWTIGGRLGVISPGQDGNLIGATGNSPSGDGKATPVKSYVGSGLSVQGDLGYHFSPAWTFYGFWEHGFVSHGDLNVNSDDGSSNFVGIGMQANTNPRGPLGFYFDVATGYRWLAFNYAAAQSPTGSSIADNKATFSGFEAIRLGLGASLVVNPQFRVDFMVTGSAGYFSHVSDTGNPCSASSDASCGKIPSDQRAMHSFGGLSISAHWDLL